MLSLPITADAENYAVTVASWTIIHLFPKKHYLCQKKSNNEKAFFLFGSALTGFEQFGCPGNGCGESSH
jgi:hypothetical protein